MRRSQPQRTKQRIAVDSVRRPVESRASGRTPTLRPLSSEAGHVREKMQEELTSLLSLPAFWANRPLPTVVIAGGVARSGTTFIEAVLDAHPQVICFQEFMPLKTTALSELLGIVTREINHERSLWNDPGGHNWRGYRQDEDAFRMFALLLACLASTTRASALAGKTLDHVKVLYCKTPSSEFHLPKLRAALPNLPLKYVHCVRDPVACLRSNWEMPWVQTGDLPYWIDGFARTLDASAKAVEEIRLAGVPVHVASSDRIWAPATRERHLDHLLGFLGIDRAEEAYRRAATPVDPWPAERRRKPPAAITEADEATFGSHPGVLRWQRSFADEL